MFQIGYRTIKTALGASLAIAIAQYLDLLFFSSAGIIAILCVQKTKQKSLQMSWERFSACIIGLLFATMLFEVIGYHSLTIAVLIILFIPTIVYLKLQSGIVTSCVIILHIYTSNTVSVALIINELLLIIIGIGSALLMNTYMPSVERQLILQQNQLERLYSKILHELAVYIRYGDRNWDGREIAESSALIQRAKDNAIQTMENKVLRHEDQYYRYFSMREKQLEIMERMMPLLTSIEMQVKQGAMLGDFLEELSKGVTPGNTASIYLEQLEDLRKKFTEMPLPTTRDEFEARASLRQLAIELEEYLWIKQQFKSNEA